TSPYVLLLSPDTPTTELYTLSLHDALPIFRHWRSKPPLRPRRPARAVPQSRYQLHSNVRHPQMGSLADALSMPSLRTPVRQLLKDRKSTRLNSSHVKISYAVFCLKKKNKKI